MLLMVFNLSGKAFQILGLKNEIRLDPWETVLATNVLNLDLNSSITIGGERLLLTLYITVARCSRFCVANGSKAVILQQCFMR